MSKWGKLSTKVLLSVLICLNAALGMAEGVLMLPESLKAIEAEAFAGVQNVSEIILPESVTTIGSRAFADSALKKINLPDSLTSIAEDAFDGSNVLVTVTEDSYAHEWCVEHDVRAEVMPEETPASSFTYTIADGAAAITKYTGSDAEVVIPAKLGGYAVVSIGANAFEDNTTVTDVTIPEGVKVIGEYAFAGCTALNGLNLPVSLETIGAHAFDGCANLNFVEFEKNVSSVGEDAFANCGEYIFFRAYPGTAPAEYADEHGIFYENNYDELYDGDYVYNVIGGEAAIVDYTGSESALEIPATMGEYAVTMIAPEAFDNREDLISVVIPEGVTLIATNAFAYCPNLTSVTLPSTIKEFYGDVFADTAITEITLPENMEYIGFYAFENCEQLTKVTVLSRDAKFADLVFTGCSEELTIYGYAGSTAETHAAENGIAFVALDGGEEPEGEKTEGDYTYTVENGEAAITAYAGSSTEVAVPAELGGYPVTTIGEYAFVEKEMAAVVIPQSVTRIGHHAFYWCQSLKNITIPASVDEIGDSAFLFAHSDLLITGARDSAAQTHAWENAIGFADAATGEVLFDNDFAYTVENGEAKLTLYTGDDTQLTVPAEYDGYTVGALRWGVMQQRDTLTHVTIEARVPSIPDAAFQNCDLLVEVRLPDSVTSIAENAFRWCGELKDVYVPASVTSIDATAFTECHSALTIHGAAGSYAEKFAGENGIAFVALDEGEES